MSLIEKMRSSTESTSTRFVIGMVVLLFVVVGGKGARGAGCQGGMAATVNGETISLADYEQAVRYNGGARGGLSDDQRDDLAKATLDKLVRERAVLQEAERLGLTVSGEEVARQLKKLPFTQKDGKYDEETYLAWLEERGLDRSSYELTIHDVLLLQKMRDLVSEGAVVTQAEVHQLWLDGRTKVDLTFVALPPAAFYGDVTVSDADRDAYVAAHADAIAAAYKADYDSLYNLPKRYTLHTIFLRKDVEGVPKEEVAARAAAISAEAHAPGADFAALAARWGEHPTATAEGSLGTVPADTLDPALVAAADAAGPGHLTDVVETVRGFQILQVDKIEEAKVISLDEAKGDIATRMIKDERVGPVIAEYATKLVSAWSAAPTTLPVDLLGAKTLAAAQTGPFPLGYPTIPKLSEGAPLPELTAALRTATEGYVLPLPVTVKGVQYVVQLTRREAPDESTFTEEAPMARLRLLDARRDAFFDAWSQHLVKQAAVQKYVQFGKES